MQQNLFSYPECAASYNNFLHIYKDKSRLMTDLQIKRALKFTSATFRKAFRYTIQDQWYFCQYFINCFKTLEMKAYPFLKTLIDLLEAFTPEMTNSDFMFDNEFELFFSFRFIVFYIR